MNPEEVKKFLEMIPIAVYHYLGRTAEDLGKHSVDTDRFRITLYQTYPSMTSWAMNEESVMSIACLTGAIRLFLEDESGFIELVPGAEVVIAKGKKYRWHPVTKEVVLLIMSTPHFSMHQHYEILDANLTLSE